MIYNKYNNLVYWHNKNVMPIFDIILKHSLASVRAIGMCDSSHCYEDVSLMTYRSRNVQVFSKAAIEIAWIKNVDILRVILWSFL